MNSKRFSPDDPASAALVALLKELLLERSEHYSRSELVAYLDGWSAALELLEKSQLVMPGAPASACEFLSASVEKVRSAQYQALQEPEDREDLS